MDLIESLSKVAKVNRLAVKVLLEYKKMCEDKGVSEVQLKNLDEMIIRFIKDKEEKRVNTLSKRGGLRPGAGKKPNPVLKKIREDKIKNDLEKLKIESFESWVERKYLDKWNEFNGFGKGLARLITYENGLKQGSREILDLVIEYWREIDEK